MPPGVAKKKIKNTWQMTVRAQQIITTSIFIIMKISFFLKGVRVPGGPEEEEVPMDGQIRKWPDLPGSPVSLIQMGKWRLKEERILGDHLGGDTAGMDPRSLKSGAVDHCLWVPVPQGHLELLKLTFQN